MRTLWRAPLLLILLCAYAHAVRWERDDSGRSVAVPDHVHRMVSLSPSLTDTVYALGAASELVGITDYTDYPPQAAREKPSVGAVVNPSLERIVALHPDIVLALPAFNGADTIAGLQRLGIPVFTFNSGNLETIYRTVAEVGRLLERDTDAQKLVLELHRREQTVRAQSAGRSRPSLLLVLAIDPLITAGHGAFITEMIAAAGGRSATDDVPQDWLEMSLESVLPRQPDYILLIRGGPVSLKDMQQHAGWSSLQAVQKGRVLTIDNRIQIPGPIAFDGLEALAKQIYGVQAH